jgi:hypothetical protein
MSTFSNNATVDAAIRRLELLSSYSEETRPELIELHATLSQYNSGLRSLLDKLSPSERHRLEYGMLVELKSLMGTYLTLAARQRLQQESAMHGHAPATVEAVKELVLSAVLGQ